jgi:hypothetical protein
MAANEGIQVPLALLFSKDLKVDEDPVHARLQGERCDLD